MGRLGLELKESVMIRPRSDRLGKSWKRAVSSLIVIETLCRLSYRHSFKVKRLRRRWSCLALTKPPNLLAYSFLFNFLPPQFSISPRSSSSFRSRRFLDAPSHLYKSVCPSVRKSVGPSVGPYFRLCRVIFRCVLGASCAVYPALF